MAIFAQATSIGVVLAKSQSSCRVYECNERIHDELFWKPQRHSACSCDVHLMTKEALTAASRSNMQLCAIFCYCATGDLHTFRLKNHHELLIGKGLARILSCDGLANNILYTDGRHRIAIKRLKSAMEKEFKLKDTLRCIDVFVCRYTTNSRFVHADIISHVFENKRLQICQAFIKEFTLKFTQAFRYPQQSLTPL